MVRLVQGVPKRGYGEVVLICFINLEKQMHLVLYDTKFCSSCIKTAHVFLDIKNTSLFHVK